MTTGADYTQHLIQKKARTVIAVPDEKYDLRTIFIVVRHVEYFFSSTIYGANFGIFISVGNEFNFLFKNSTNICQSIK